MLFSISPFYLLRPSPCAENSSCREKLLFSVCPASLCLCPSPCTMQKTAAAECRSAEKSCCALNVLPFSVSCPLCYYPLHSVHSPELFSTVQKLAATRYCLEALSSYVDVITYKGDTGKERHDIQSTATILCKMTFCSS